MTLVRTIQDLQFTAVVHLSITNFQRVTIFSDYDVNIQLADTKYVHCYYADRAWYFYINEAESKYGVFIHYIDWRKHQKNH